MEIKTSKGDLVSVDFIAVATNTSGRLIMQLTTDKTISEVASLFEGCETIQKTSETEGNEIFAGYTRISCISVKNENHILVSLERV